MHILKLEELSSYLNKKPLEVLIYIKLNININPYIKNQG